ncbi:unnamed protein product [Amoebophrya sp. A25]|nr:unnamed protein product [Amoebophrya sp. A25]|eukprot:GSA25T00023357001.1
MRQAAVVLEGQRQKETRRQRWRQFLRRKNEEELQAKLGTTTPVMLLQTLTSSTSAASSDSEAEDKVKEERESQNNYIEEAIIFDEHKSPGKQEPHDTDEDRDKVVESDSSVVSSSLSSRLALEDAEETRSSTRKKRTRPTNKKKSQNNIQNIYISGRTSQQGVFPASGSQRDVDYQVQVVSQQEDQDLREGDHHDGIRVVVEELKQPLSSFPGTRWATTARTQPPSRSASRSPEALSSSTPISTISSSSKIDMQMIGDNTNTAYMQVNGNSLRPQPDSSSSRDLHLGSSSGTIDSKSRGTLEKKRDQLQLLELLSTRRSTKQRAQRAEHQITRANVESEQHQFLMQEQQNSQMLQVASGVKGTSTAASARSESSLSTSRTSRTSSSAASSSTQHGRSRRTRSTFRSSTKSDQALSSTSEQTLSSSAILSSQAEKQGLEKLRRLLDASGEEGETWTSRSHEEITLAEKKPGQDSLVSVRRVINRPPRVFSEDEMNEHSFNRITHRQMARGEAGGSLGSLHSELAELKRELSKSITDLQRAASLTSKNTSTTSPSSSSVTSNSSSTNATTTFPHLLCQLPISHLQPHLQHPRLPREARVTLLK